jgi:hypothetical protein
MTNTTEIYRKKVAQPSAFAPNCRTGLSLFTKMVLNGANCSAATLSVPQLPVLCVIVCFYEIFCLIR